MSAVSDQKKRDLSMGQAIRRLLPYYHGYEKIFAADIFFAVLSSAAALIIPLVVRYVTSTLIYLPGDEIKHQIIIIALILLGILAVDWVSRFFMTYWGHVMSLTIESNMREEIFNHMESLSFNFFDDAKVGKLMSRITTDLFDISELIHHGPENVIISFLKIAGALIILANINGWLTLAAFVILPVMFYVAYAIDKKRHAAYKVNRAKIASVNGQIEDSLSGIRVSKSFANEDVEAEKFHKNNEAFRQAKKNSYYYMALFFSWMRVFTTLIEVCVIIIGSILIAHDMLSVVDLVTFLLYISVFVDPIRVMVDFTDMFQSGITGFERFLEIIDIEPDIKDAPGAVDIDEVQGRITFSDVTFRYPESQSAYMDGDDDPADAQELSTHRRAGQDVLRHLSLEIPAGSYTAICGSSGVGKTTLCSLIPRFYEVTEGAVLVDGRDVRSLTLKSLRNHIGVVAQDVYLFAGTIAENIAYGKPGASMEEIIEAAKQANAHEFIMSFPDGYDTDIGQRGVKLSGGQKQRLSIARVFLKNPPILIFDEATSALDNESERVVQESLERLAHGRTTLVIAHRLTTIQNAEKILVLTEEGIAESGTHAELLAKGGIYEKFYNAHR